MRSCQNAARTRRVN